MCEISSEFIEKWLFYKDFCFFTFSLIGFGAQLIGPIQLHVKRQNSSICKFFQDIAWTFSVCEWQDLSFTYQKSEKTTYLDNLVFSAFSVLWGTVKNPGWNPTRVRRYLGSAPGSLWQNSPHKDAFFCISLTNIDQSWITCTFKVE